MHARAPHDSSPSGAVVTRGRPAPSAPPLTPHLPTPRRAVPAAVLTGVGLGAAFVVVTLLAAGPLASVDAALHRRWVLELTPAWEPFLQHGLDRIASQPVCLPVLLVTAGVIALRRRSWRPLAVAAAAELTWLVVVGAAKVLFARPAPVTDRPHFGDGGLFRLGELGISYPSGHAAEVFLIYGTAVYLVARYTSAPARVVRLLRFLVGALAVNTVAVSFWLGWHWVTDLVGGLLLGACLLAAVVALDRRGCVRA